MECKYCQGFCIKKGCQNRRQKYYCKACKSHQQKTYTYRLCTAEDERTIVKLNNIGVGINGIARFTGMSKANVINKIRDLSKKTTKPVINEEHQEYETDEMHTIIENKRKSCYIIYAINNHTRQVIDFIVGSRTKENIGKVISTVNLLNPKKIFTDKLNIYPGLINKSVHSTIQYKTNHIERNNLNLRMNLKRLSRKTICYSKSIGMLESCLRLYFWHRIQLDKRLKNS
jgi:insertion element IS1 protein InsB